MSRTRMLALFVLALVVALPLAAEPPDSAGPSVSALEPLAEVPPACASSFVTPPLNVARNGGTPDVGAQSDCTAQCEFGSVTCDQGTSCTAVDASCPGEDGYCWDNVGGYQYCATCTEPCPGPSCEEVDGTFCKFTGDTCYAGLNCFEAQCFCNNNVNICP